MSYLARYTSRTLIRELGLIVLAAAWWLPFYALVVVALKSPNAALTYSLKPPQHLDFGNFPAAWAGTGGISLGRALVNSLVITVGSVVALIAIGSVSAWVLARRTDRVGTLLYIAFVLGLIFPIQLGLVPLYVAMRHLGLLGTRGGAVLLYTGILMPLTIFLYTSFARALPIDYEEAALVDGASRVRIFRKVVFPLLRPITGTVAVLTGLIIWNDFFTQLVFFGGGPSNRTLPVAIYGFVGQFTTQWNVVFAAVAIALAPILLFYLFAQRQLIRGFTGGIKA